ncbi:hypothetical protein KCU78_g15312, partial [Aureobasidium melanogenum]
MLLNPFRILGDVSHTVSKCILIWSIHTNKSAEGAWPLLTACPSLRKRCTVSSSSYAIWTYSAFPIASWASGTLL